MHAAQLVSMACRHLHEGKAVLWHVPETRESDVFFYFTPTRTGARVQQLTREIAHQVASSPTHVCLSIDQLLEYRRMQFAPDAIASAVQVLQSEEYTMHLMGRSLSCQLPSGIQNLCFACSCRSRPLR